MVKNIINQGLAALYNPQEIIDLENKFGSQYGVQNTASGPLSDARHMSAMNNLSNTLSNSGLGIAMGLPSEFAGDVAAFGAGLINELPALGRGFNKQNLGEITEDIAANYAGSFGTPNTATAQGIYEDVFSRATPQEIATMRGGPFANYGTAQASEVTPQNEPMDIEDFLGTSTPKDLGFIGMAPGIKEAVGITDRGRGQIPDTISAPFSSPGAIITDGPGKYEINPDGKTASLIGRANMSDIAGDINLNMTDLGNPTGDPRVVSEEQGLLGAISNRGRGMAAPGEMGAYEMIGGTPVAIGDKLGKQMALEKADFIEEPTTKRNAFNDLLSLASLAYTGPYEAAVKGANLFNNIRTGKVGRIASGIGSLGNTISGKLRGINPNTGRPNTQSQYEQARAARQQQNRVDRVAARLAAGKKTLSDPYSIAKTEAQRQQIRDGRIKGAEKEAAKDPYSGYGSCFIAGTKVSMADGTFKNIEYVKVGDKIKGHKEDNTVIKLDPTSLGNRKLYSFNNNQHYFFTSEHPFMTEEGWKSIKPEKTEERDGVELYDQLRGELKVGDKLVTDNGLVQITNIDSKEMNSPEMSLYNFNVSNDNSYIADGYIVHNKGGGGKIVCTMMNER